MGLRTDPDFLRLIHHLATGINRLWRLRISVAKLLRKVRHMSKQTDALAAALAQLETAVAANADGLKALTALHVDVSAKHDDDSAAIEVLTSHVEGITKAVLASKTAAADAVKQTESKGQAETTGETDTSYELGHQPDTSGLVAGLSGTEPETAVDRSTGLPVTAGEAAPAE